MVASLATAGVLLASCGGDEAGRPAAVASADVQTDAGAEERSSQPRADGVTMARGVSKEPTSKGAKDKLRAATIAATSSAPGSTPVGGAPSAASPAGGEGDRRGKAAKNESKGKGSAGEKPSTKPKTPKGPAANGQAPKGDPYTKESVYELARSYCGNREFLQYVPEEELDDPEGLAQMTRQFAPPGTEQAAYEGCLAGLHSIGL